MRKTKIIMRATNHLKLLGLGLLFVACQKNDISGPQTTEHRTQVDPYSVLYTDQQLDNWKETGNPFLESEHKNAKTTLIDKTIPSHAGVFEPIPVRTKAFGVHPYQNRFWTMIRLKIGIPILNSDDYDLKNNVVTAISEIEAQTNIRFYNAILDPDTDPVWGFKYPNVFIQKAMGSQKGSSYIGLKGGEQYIYLPVTADVPFIKRALMNVAGMYNEQQRYDRDSYVDVYTHNVDPSNRYHFDKITTNYFSLGYFDFNSITLAGSYEYSSPQYSVSIRKKNNTHIVKNDQLSSLDRSFVNYFYLPFIARTDVYRELDDVVYTSNNTQLTPSQRQELQDYLNNYAPYPGTANRIQQQDW